MLQFLRDQCWSSIRFTSEHSFSAWARVGTIGVFGLAAIGVVDAIGAPTNAQVTPIVNEVVSVGTDGAPLTGTSGAPSVSDDGSVVVFSNAIPAAGDSAASHQLVVRSRPSDGVGSQTDIVYPGVDESSPTPVLGAVSDNGCIVAYSAVVPATETPVATSSTTTTTTTSTTVVAEESEGGGGADGGDGGGDAGDGGGGDDGGSGGTTDGDGSGGDAGAEAAEVTSDGSDARAADEPVTAGPGSDAGSDGAADVAVDPLSAAQIAPGSTELRTVDRCVPDGTAFVQNVLAAVTGELSLPAPALSTDGAVIAWPIDDAVSVYSSTSRAGAEVSITVRSDVAGDSVGNRLDLSADGRVLVFESGAVNPDFGSSATDANQPGSPVLANVYLADLPAALDAAPAAPVSQLLAPSRAGSSGPSLSGDGAFVVYESDAAGLLPDAPEAGPYLVLADRSAGAVAQRVLTTGASNARISTDASSVIYNAFDSVRVRRSDTPAPFDESTEMIVNAALSAQFDESVGASVSTPGLSGNGELAVFDHVAGVDLSADVATRAAGHVWAVETPPIFAPPPEPVDTTTTTVAVSTIPVGTVPPTVRATTPRNTTRNTTRTTSRVTTTTTPAVIILPSFDPAAFEFAPTIAGSGRRTAEVALVNPSTEPITVSSLAVQPADAGFGIDASACQNEIPAGQRCAVSLSFAPPVAGEATANLVATLGDGTTVTSALRGLGADSPMLTVLPEVASNGQVVSVFGTGFPAGAIVEFSWNRGQVQSNIVVDDAGGFTESLVVLPNTVSGPVEMRVAGQTDLFGDVTSSVLVTSNGGQSATAVLGGIGSGGLGR